MIRAGLRGGVIRTITLLRSVVLVAIGIRFISLGYEDMRILPPYQ